MTFVDFIESSLRGGAAAICVILIVQLLSRKPLRAAALFGALFFAGAAIYSIVALPMMRETLGLFIVPFKLIGMLSPAFFWLFILAVLDDNYRWRGWHALPGALIGAMYLSCLPFPDFEPYSKTIQLVIVAGLMAHAIYIVRCCIGNDLVTARRYFSKAMGFLVPVIALAIMGIEILETIESQSAIARLSVAAVIVTTAITLALTMSSLRKSLLPETEKSPRTITDSLSAADRIDLGRLRDLMEEGAYLNPGLTIGEMAKLMNVPEHRLRRLINAGLDYRNFAAFLNDHRIDEAKRRLARPSLAREQITNLAFDLGYASLAPVQPRFQGTHRRKPYRIPRKIAWRRIVH